MLVAFISIALVVIGVLCFAAPGDDLIVPGILLIIIGIVQMSFWINNLPPDHYKAVCVDGKVYIEKPYTPVVLKATDKLLECK